MAVSEKLDLSYQGPTVDSFEVEKRQPVIEVSNVDLSEMLETLHETVKEHEPDPNFPLEILSSARAALRESPHKLQANHLQWLVAAIQAERALLLNDSP